MAKAVDNLDKWASLVAHDELPYHEALCRLYELSERYGDPNASTTAGSAVARHRERTGHALAFGCCQTQESIMAAIRRDEQRLLRTLEREACD